MRLLLLPFPRRSVAFSRKEAIVEHFVPWRTTNSRHFQSLPPATPCRIAASQDFTSDNHGMARFAIPLMGVACAAAILSTQLLDNKTSCETSSEAPSTDNDDDDVSKLRMCGQWCASAATDENTPCRMDESKLPCLGKYCATTAGLWSLFMLGPYSKNRPVSCEMYKDGIGYPIGACPCDPACLIAEIKKERYPQPTGFGVMCKPGTCQPAASPRHKGSGEGLGTLACPCNWFGSECTDDWIPIQRLEKQRIGTLDKVTLTVAKSNWSKIMKDYRPGAVVRLNMWNKNDHDDATIHEMACVISDYNSEKGQLDVLVAPACSSLHPSVRYVTDLLRSYEQDGQIASEKEIYVNPAISGFYNARYQYLTEYIAEQSVKKVVLLATGSTLGGAMSVLDSLEQNDDVTVRLYYGLRDVSLLPYAEKLSKWARSGKLELILVENNPAASNFETSNSTTGDDNSSGEQGSSPMSDDTDKTSRVQLSPEILVAAARGDALKAMIRLYKGKKFYVQHVFEQHLRDLNDDEDDVIVVVCGRIPVIDDTRKILERHGHDVTERLFLNI